MDTIAIEMSVVELELLGADPRCWLLTGAGLRERARALTESAGGGATTGVGGGGGQRADPNRYGGVGDAKGRSSRSYREPYALVASWRAQVGVDIERIEPVDAGFGSSIATPLEREMFSGRLSEERLVAELWSGKEALSKALGDSLRYDPRRLDAPLGWAESLGARAADLRSDGDGMPVAVGTQLEAGVWRAQRLPVPEGYVGWLCWRV